MLLGFCNPCFQLRDILFFQLRLLLQVLYLLLVLVYCYLRIAQFCLQLVSGCQHLIYFELALLYLLFMLSLRLNNLLQLYLLCAESLLERVYLLFLAYLDILELLSLLQQLILLLLKRLKKSVFNLLRFPSVVWAICIALFNLF